MKKQTKKRMDKKEFFKPVINATGDITTKNILTKALDYNSGIESQLQNPDKMLDDNNEDLTLYDTMMLDDKIKNTLEIFKKMCTSVGGSFAPASKDPADVEIADFIDKMFNSMTIRLWDVFDNLLDARAYGFKCGELMWDVVDGKVTLKNIKFKHSLYFDFEYDEFADLAFVLVGYRVANETRITADEFRQKFIHFVNPYLKDQNYYGESDLMAIYEAWRGKVKINRFRNIYLQNYGFPIPICTYDAAKFTSAEKTTLEDQLENFQEQMYFLIPGSKGADGKLVGKVDIQFHKAETSGGSASFSDAIDQIDKQIARKLLIPDKAGYSESPGGSYSMAEQQFDAMKLFLQDYQGRLEDCINKVIKLAVDFNFANVENYPEWKFEADDSKITEAMLTVLIDKGVIDKSEKWIRQFVGIPELTKEEKDELLVAKAGEPSVPMAPSIPQQFKADSPVNFKKLKEQYNTFEADFLRDYNRIMFNNNLDLIRQIKAKKIIENNDLSLIKTIRMPKTDLKDLYSNYFAKLYLTGKGDGADEVDSRLKKIEKTLMKSEYEEFKPSDDELWIDREWVDKYLKQYGSLGKLSTKDREFLKNYRQKAFYVTGNTEEEALKTIEQTIASGIRNGQLQSVIIAKITESLTDDTKKYGLTIARTNSSEAYNSGRQNLFNDDRISPFIEAYQYSAVMDDATTPFCEQHDGQIIYPSDPDFPTINPPNHYNCRSLLIPIMVGQGEEEGGFYEGYDKNMEAWGTGVTKEGRVQSKDFGG